MGALGRDLGAISAQVRARLETASAKVAQLQTAGYPDGDPSEAAAFDQGERLVRRLTAGLQGPAGD